MNKNIFANLRDILADLYPDESSLRRLTADSGIVLSHIVLNSNAKNNWHSLLTEANKINQIEALLCVVENEYGRNEEFRSICDIYRQSVSQISRTNIELLRSANVQETQHSQSELRESYHGRNNNQGHDMIDREDAVNLFHELVQPDSHFRIIRLLGAAKTGKTHLLTKVFPKLARQQYGYKYAVLDLRNRAQNAIEFLHMICSILGDNYDFPSYYAYYQQWLNRPKREAQGGIQDFLSKINLANRNMKDEARNVLPEMTRLFVKDLRHSHREPLLLIFDSVNEATDDLQSWLMDTLLVQLSRVEHIRIVVSGRVLPEISGTYVNICQNYHLTPVVTLQAYIAYCQKVNVELSEQSIRDFAKAFDYNPGLFVECVLSKFVRGSISHV